MKQLRKLFVICVMVWSVFLTGCDASKITEFIQKVAAGIEKALPEIQNVVDAVKNVSQTVQDAAGGGNTGGQGTDQAATNRAGVVIPAAGDQENLGNATTAGTTSGPLQQRVSSSIKSLIGSTRFRGREVDGGNLACAQVVTTALKMAGALNSVVLNCDAAVSALRAKGWRRVSVPPYQDGDVVTWTTSRGPGRHIGIIVKEGNSFVAVSNSSSQRTPRKHRINYQPITQVLRKA